MTAPTFSRTPIIPSSISCSINLPFFPITLSLSLSISISISFHNFKQLRVLLGMSSKKVVLKLDLHDDRGKQKAMKVVSKIQHIDSITIDMKDRKLTVIGDIDPVDVVNKVRKYWTADIFSVGPAKEPEKKKDEPAKKKDEGKKEGGGGEGGGDNKKKESNGQIPAYNPYMVPYNPHIVTYNHQMYYPQHVPSHYPPMASPYYVQHEENPNECVIC